MAEVKPKYKTKLIDKINSISDKNILDEINRLLEIDGTIYETSIEQKNEIKLAQQCLKNNQGISSHKADDEIEEWLSK
ncbi:MAG: hypothetical protein ACJA2S_000114 [Cyclobacteriaceae bacterium]|jgi:hypothetical protein